MELPKNITQIGEVDKVCKVYVEDYVVSYIKQLNREAENREISVALYGRHEQEDGVDYHFVSREEFDNLKAINFFAEVGEYNGWFYGSAKDDCTDNKVAVLTPHGLRQLRKNKKMPIR